MIYDGIYTVETPDGHRTFLVRTQAQDADFAPGKTVMSYLSGPDNSKDYTGFAFVVHRADGSSINVWKRHRDNEALVRDVLLFSQDVENALVAAHCSACHRILTVPASIFRGLGPDCAKKGK
jgi:hypothetical protein